MSFSTDVKEELANYRLENRHCVLSELNALLKHNYILNNNVLEYESENRFYIHRLYQLINNHFHCRIQIRSIKIRKNKFIYNLRLINFEDMIKAVNLNIGNNIEYNRNKNYYLKNDCCKASYIRGEFISSASVTDPKKSYHLEFVKKNIDDLELIKKILLDFSISSKIVKRKNYYVLYIKDSSKVSDILCLIGAHKFVLDLENLKVYKDIRNNLNRHQNLEMANLSKTIKAAVNQIDDINYIIEFKGIDYLPDDLKSLALIRLSETDITLQEIGEKFNPPISKSSVYYKLKKISKMANKIRSV